MSALGKRAWTGRWQDCYHRWDDDEQVGNVKAFCSVANFMDDLNDDDANLYWPNFKAAPWHLQCVVQVDGEMTKLNFWPHKAKAQVDYRKVQEGWGNVNELIASIFSTDEEEEFDVIE